MSRLSVPRTVWVLGIVSLLMDVSSEMIQTLLPIYLVVGLGASATVIGLVEGFAVAVATAVKFGAGFLSDRIARPKWLAVAGYGLAAAAKPIFPLSASVEGVLLAKGVDRIGKGIRTAPRDALVAAVTPPTLLGRAFGLRKSLDTVGGFAGPLLAIGLMMLLADDIKAVFWLASIPAALAVLLLVIGVSDPPRPEGEGKRPPDLKGALHLNAATWSMIGLTAVIGLARFSESFLLLKGLDVGVSAAFAPAAIVLLHLVFGLAAFPIGALSDRIGRTSLLVLSLIFLAAADVVLVLAVSPVLYYIGVALWGLHMGFSAGLMMTLIADVAPPHLRGSAFGLFALISGVIALAGNLAAGLLWDGYGPQATFAVGAVLSLACAIIVALWSIRRPNQKS
ncbi:MFS transporter [Brevundimonas sp.]|uniref:MFS transporter n=1 Tax=Brevundimonas sp. TaxID=1871086 RepID=UPI002899064C|nr:MFS transporter [Brevundimonas sp.]